MYTHSHLKILSVVINLHKISKQKLEIQIIISESGNLTYFKI